MSKKIANGSTLAAQVNQQHADTTKLTNVVSQIMVGKNCIHSFELPDFSQLSANFIGAWNDVFEESGRQFGEVTSLLDALTGRNTNLTRVSPVGVFLSRMMMNNLHTNLNADFTNGDQTRLSLYGQEGKWHSIIRECVANHTKDNVLNTDSLNADADYVEANLNYQRAVGQREMTEYLLNDLRTWHKEASGQDYVPVLIQRKDTGPTATKAAMIKAQMEKNGFGAALKAKMEQRVSR